MFLFLFLFSGLTWSKTPALKVGDVLLQPLDCWACSLIEAEEQTIFSHVGVVLAVDPVLVAEAYSKVRYQTLDEFNSKTQKNQKILVLRFRNQKLVNDLTREQGTFEKIYVSEFHGLKYDSEFRWNNFDENGEEKIYCSELVSKLFSAFADIELPLKRMHFQQNRSSWSTFFRGNIPDNEWGNSPGDLHRSDLFYEVGEL